MKRTQRERDMMSDMSSMGGGDFIVISEHEGADGERYYRRSGEMAREHAEDRMRWIIEESGAISATMAQVVSERKRLYQSVVVDREEARGFQLGGSLSGKKTSTVTKAKA